MGNMDKSIRFCLAALLLSSIRAESGSNDSSIETQRVPRVSGRIVKVYSGNRPEPYLCNSEGYKADPHSCASFYRCVKERSGKFNVFRYQCAPGTVYDPDIETCNHPRNTRRTECGGVMKPLAELIDTTLANGIYYNHKEIPRPISNNLVSKITTVEHTSEWTASSQNVPSTKKPSETYRSPPVTSAFSTLDTSKNMPEYNNAITSPWESSTLSSSPIITSLPKLTSNSDDICTGDGFTGDPENCRKFYRCIENQRGGYLRYEFFCSESTVWDEAVQSCNHPWAVKRSKCGRSLELTDKSDTTVLPSSHTSTHQPPQMTAEYGQKINKTIQQQLQVSYGSKVTQTQTQISHSNDVIQNQTQIAHGSAVSQTQTQIDYGNEIFQTQVQIDHTKNSSQSQTQIHDITTSRSSTSHQDFTNTNGCSESGFIGDPNDCKKFYRCVDNGRGTFTKYEYSCGDGTVWDQSIEACNHAWAVKECGGQSHKEPENISTMKSTTYNAVTSNTQKTSSHSNYYTSTSETPEINDIDIGYGSPASSDVTEFTTSLTTTTTTEFPSKVDNTDCSSTGFIGDANDCKKFYRCVENSRGVYTKHEFKCGEGTVWDPDIESCNHEWAVKNCGSNSNKGTTTVNDSASSSAVHTTVTLIQTTTQLSSTIDDYDTGYGIQNPQTTAEPVKTTKEHQYETTEAAQNLNSNNECRNSGFIGDATNCKKFYRCVDNGMGGYTKYEFTCGEGTLWDPSIEACNHAWAVENCGGISNTTETESTSEIFTSPTNLETMTTKTTLVDKNTDEPVHTPTTSSTFTSSATEPNVDNICKHSGFMGHSNNCKIFYRCVDNGDGSFTRYDFTCGEGTVWDPTIEACNHEWAVEKCGSTIESTSSSYTSTSKNPPLPDNIKDDETTTQSHEITSTTQSLTTTIGNDISISNQECNRDGFVGDKNDCRKFYRCVVNGNGDYDRYEFYCGEGTVWDENISSCNHAWAVKECSANDNTTQTNNENTSESSLTTTETKDTTIHSIEISTSITGNPSENEVNDGECENEGFFGSVVDCKKFYRCVDDGKGGFTKYEFSCGEGTAWNTNIQACDHSASDYPCGQNYQSTTKESHVNDEIITETTTKLTPTTPISSSSGSSNETQKPQSSGKCELEGFYGNPSDCKQFFRCVSDGKGGYIKYDFTCGDGTMWNQEIQTCDHESDDKQCLHSGSGPPEDGGSQQQSTTSGSQLESSTSFSSTTDHPPQTDKTESPPSFSDDKCTAEGFFAHTNDCKKFVRCVSNVNGEYTRYEFSCGEGTVWVQDIQACDHDNGIKNCSRQNESTIKPEDNSSSSTSSSTIGPSYSSTESQTQKEDDVYATSKKPSNTETDECTSEGYFGNKNDCRKFYRCVDNGDGSYIKYSFDCGEGTAWDSNIQTCNHINEVATCSGENIEEIPTHQTMKDDEVSQTTESLASTTKGTTSSGSTEESGSSNEPGSGSNDSCTSEGYFGNSKDCKKFYRCVDNGSGGFTKYEFDCGDGTIWDQDITTCNHPQDVTNPSCKPEGGGGGGGGGVGGGEENSQISSSSSTSTTQSSPPSSGSTESSSQTSSNCSQEDSSKKPTSGKDITCEKAGYYANPNDCKKFYRCVDWDGDGKRFSVYHFECGEGTIWDPALDTCNHEESVYPPRDCSQTQTQTESSSTNETTTQKHNESTAQESTTSEQTTHASTTSEQTTTQQSTTSEQTTVQQTSTDQTTTQESTTLDSTTQQSTTGAQSTTQESTTNEQTTQQSTTSQQTTTEQSTISEQTTTQQSTTSEQTTTQQSTTSEQTTTQQSTTDEQTTTQQSTTNEQTTTESATSEPTTQETTTSEQTTEQASTQESTTSESSTTQATTTEQVTDLTSEQTESSTTEGTTEISTTDQSSTTSEVDHESTTHQSPEKECPETEDDQNVFVCPTSFKRHPKYCNMFYQCTEDDDTHDIKIATFKCPNETIYDESQTQCVEEKKADKKCTGEMARRHRFKRLHRDSQDPITVANKLSCPAVGYYALEKNVECSNGFLKCETNKSGKLRGFIHQCPEGYLFWSISKRCELGRNIRDCKRSSNDWKNRWNIPIDRKNVAL